MNLISGKGETSSRLPGPFSLFLPGSCPNNRNRRKDPSPDLSQQELARIRRSIGEALRTQGDLAGALAADQEAVRIMGELTTKAPAQTSRQRDLAVSHGKAGLD